MKLSAREKVLITILVVLVGGGGYLWFVLLPTINSISELEASMGTLDIEIAMAQSRQTNHATLIQAIELLQEEWDAVTNLPDYFNYPTILDQLHTIVYPYAEEANISAVFPTGAGGYDPFMVGDQHAMYITSVTLAFHATIENTGPLFEGLAQAPIYSRVADRNITITDPENPDLVVASVTIDYLTLYPRRLNVPVELPPLELVDDDD